MLQQTYHGVVALVGRPNVGKSTLFNKMIKSRKSLVFNEPGVTRDRLFAKGIHDGIPFYVCDTGGFEPTSKDNIKKQLADQAQLAIEESHTVVFVVDGREGVHPVDRELIHMLRKAQKPFIVCVNKCDLPKDDILMEEFRILGAQHILPISAEHSRGLNDLLDTIIQNLGTATQKNKGNESENIRLSIVGKPNVGKSSILNRLVGESRSIVDDRPGTTRDAVDVFLKYHGRELQIVDTAGIRRKSRMSDTLEKFSALRSLVCLEECDVAVLVIDASQGVTDADLRVAGYAFEQRKPILIVVNKWDLIEEKTSKSAQNFVEKLHIDLKYLRYAPVIFVSALENLRVAKILPKCLEIYDQSAQRFSTSKVNTVLRNILLKHTPPLTKNRKKKIKFFYATQVSACPPCFVIFCSHPQEVHFSYKRFLENEFREAFAYKEVPIRLILRERNRRESKDHVIKNSVRNYDDLNFDKNDDVFALEITPLNDEDIVFTEDDTFSDDE